MLRFFFLSYTSIILMILLFQGCQENRYQPPNILFCIADDASFPHMGAYGCNWIKTPAFDQIASQGLLFMNAYTPNAKCAPSRASILTGRNSWQLEAAANHWCFFPEKFKTYAEVLTENDYYVGYTAKGWAPGVAINSEGQPRQLTGIPFHEKKITPPAAHISNTDYAGNFVEFLASKPANQPFCFWYGGREPHRRYEYQAGIKKGGKSLSDIDRVYPFWPDNETVRTDMLDYAYELEYFDLHLQQMLEHLQEKGELENTLIIVTADNGMPFPRIKGQEYEYANHLPLAIMWKKGIKNPGRIVNDFVSFIDFAPTFLELAGISQKISGMQPIQGRSLNEIFYSAKSGSITPGRNFVLIGKERHDVGRPNDEGYPIRGIVKGDYLYLKNFEPERWPAGNPETGYLNCDGSPTKSLILNLNRHKENKDYWKWSFGKRPLEELYHIKDDPECMSNLAENRNFEKIKSDLRKQLEEELNKQKDPRMKGKGYVFDQYKYGDIKTQNFYERFMRGEKIDAGWVDGSDFEK